MLTYAKLGLIAAALAANGAAGTALLIADDHAGPAQRIVKTSQNGVRLRPAPQAFIHIRLSPPYSKQLPILKANATSPDDGMTIRRILSITEPIRYGQWYWETAGVPQGRIAITVDLDARVLSVFRDGYEIGTTAVLLGSQEKPTPLGVFPITQKDAHHVSNLYDAKMPYMLRLTNDGVTIHATKVQRGYASHGCIGVPLDFAERLFTTARLGDRVFITRGKHATKGPALEKLKAA